MASVVSVVLPRRRNNVVGTRFTSLFSDHSRTPALCSFHVHGGARAQLRKPPGTSVVVLLLSFLQVLENRVCVPGYCRLENGAGAGQSAPQYPAHEHLSRRIFHTCDRRVPQGEKCKKRIYSCLLCLLDHLLITVLTFLSARPLDCA